jgi:hypothetical protein
VGTISSMQPIINLMKNLIIVTVGLGLSIATTVLVSVNGWGLSPKNWWWIVLGNLVGNMIAQIVIKLAGTK